MMENPIRRLGRPVKRYLLSRFSRRYRIHEACVRLLPDLTCIDVGASYYPHPAWGVFQRSRHTTWIAIDPNAANLGYIENWPWPAKVVPVGEAVSEHGGECTLYVTRVDSGSSLLKPDVPPPMVHRTDASYFFPVVEKAIQTRSLADVVREHGTAEPTLIKLDTQGTEFHILKGLDKLFIRNHVICVELESTLLATPYYQGSARFHEVQEFMEAHGFELAYLKPICGAYPKANPALTDKQVLNECDAVFFLRPDLIASRSLAYQRAMVGCYIAYEYFGEALHLARALLRNPGAAEQHRDLRVLESILA